eukprot:87944_1
MYYLFISTDFHHVIGKVNRPHQTQCAHPSNTLEAFLHDKVISLTLTLPAPDMGSIPTAGVSVSLPHFTLFFLKKNTAVLRKPIVNTIPVRNNKSPRARRALSNRRIVPKSKNRNPTATTQPHQYCSSTLTQFKNCIQSPIPTIPCPASGSRFGPSWAHNRVRVRVSAPSDS